MTDARCSRTPIPRCGARGTRSRAATRSTARPVRARLLGEDWVLVRLPDGDAAATTLAAFVDRCPHRLAPLSAGWVDGYVAALRLSRLVLRRRRARAREIPSLGDARARAAARGRDHARPRSRSGTAWCSSRPSRRVTELLDVPEADDPAFTHGALEPIRARVGAGLMIDNFLDMAHFPFVHAATIGTPESETFEFTVERDGLGMQRAQPPPVPAPRRSRVSRRASGRWCRTRALEYRYRAPFSICLRIDYVEAGGTNVLDFYVQPEDDDHCRIYTTVHRNDLDGDPHGMAEASRSSARSSTRISRSRSGTSTGGCRSTSPPRCT